MRVRSPAAFLLAIFFLFPGIITKADVGHDYVWYLSAPLVVLGFFGVYSGLRQASPRLGRVGAVIVGMGGFAGLIVGINNLYLLIFAYGDHYSILPNVFDMLGISDSVSLLGLFYMVMILGIPLGFLISGIAVIWTVMPSRAIGWLLVAYAVVWVPTGVAADLFADGVIGIHTFVLARLIMAAILFAIGYLVYADRKAAGQIDPEMTEEPNSSR